MEAPLPDAGFWTWALNYLWIPAIGAIGGYVSWIERRLAKKASKEFVDEAFKKIDTILTKHIEQDRENFIALFAKIDANKDSVNDKFSDLKEKISINHLTLVQLIAAKQDRRSTDKGGG